MDEFNLVSSLYFIFQLFCSDISKDDDLPPVVIDSVAFRSLIVQALGSLHGKV